jgi:hypothetical protein
VPAGQAHVPLVQTWPVAQRRPHMPQLATSVFRLVSHPAVIGSQSPKPVLQAKPQVPAVQVALALGAAAQARPHMPQLVTVVRAVSQPFPAMPSQLP